MAVTQWSGQDPGELFELVEKLGEGYVAGLAGLACASQLIQEYHPHAASQGIWGCAQSCAQGEWLPVGTQTPASVDSQG